MVIGFFDLSLETYYRNCGYFYIDIDVLYLGGPELCHGGFPSNFTFDDNISPSISITLCGVPKPVLQGKFNGQKLNVIYATVNRYTHNFTLQLPLLAETACGRELQVTATGYNGTLIDITKIFVWNCKYDYHVHLFLVLSHSSSICPESFHTTK